MEEVDARAVLQVTVESPVSEIEAVYRVRVGEVRTRFEKAQDDRTRKQLKRELATLQQARDTLVNMSVDLGDDASPDEPDDRVIERPSVEKTDSNTPEPPVEPIAVLDEPKAGQTFAGRFELRRELSDNGAMWLAEDRSLQRSVALRFLPDVISRDQKAVEDLQKEVRVRIELKHPNLARIYALVEDKGRIAVSTEYVDGPSLAQLRLSKPNQVFEVKDLEIWVKELCGALEHFHKEAGLVHGRVAPNYLVVNPAGSLQLTDLGIARLVNDLMVRLTGIAGLGETLAYSSPQQAMREELTVTDDVYSLGANLYEFLTGKPPFYTGEILVQIEDKIPPSIAQRRAELGIKGESIPKNCEETIAACLAKEPSRRPGSASEVARRLATTNVQSVISPVSHQAVTTPVPLPPGPIERFSAPVRPPPAPVDPSPTPVQPPAPVKRVSNPVRPPLPPVEPVKPHPVSVRPVPSPAKPSPAPIGPPSTTVKPPQVPARPASRPTKPSRDLSISSLARRPGLAIGGIIFFLVLASLIAFFWYRSARGPETGKLVNQASPELSAQPSPSATIEKSTTPVATPSVEATAAPSPQATTTPSVEETTTPTSEQTATPGDVIPSSTPLSQGEIDATKEEVIKRINALPGYTEAGKAILMEKMQKARSMQRLIVVSFENGQTALRGATVDQLLKTFETPEMREKLSDPTIFLVVAGYADAGGRADLNLTISRERAENVTKILKRRLKLTNAIQTVGMGGTELLNSKRPDQNRAVEIWVVAPF